MPPRLEAHANLYSPRWGHEDRYTLTFEDNSLTIGFNANWAKAVWDNPNSDAVWEDSGRELFGILSNDQIYPTRLLPELLEYLWRKWRDEEINPQQLQNELDALVNYINIGTHGKPTTDFWRAYF